MSNQIIENLKKRAEKYEFEISIGVIELNPFIVEFVNEDHTIGGFTATTNEKNQIIIHNTDHPTQFSHKAVEIIKTCKFSNGLGELKPVVYTRRKWYAKELPCLKELIAVLEGCEGEAQKGVSL